MTGCGIFSGDLLIVDRSVDLVDGAVVIAVRDLDFFYVSNKKAVVIRECIRWF